MQEWSFTLAPSELAGFLGQHPQNIRYAIRRGYLEATLEKRGKGIRRAIRPEAGLAYMESIGTPPEIIAATKEVLEEREQQVREAVRQRAQAIRSGDAVATPAQRGRKARPGDA